MKLLLTFVGLTILCYAIRGAPASYGASSSTLPGDVNGDCVVNALDLGLFAQHYLAAEGSLLYSSAYDLNGDGVINVLDLQIMAAHFSMHC